VTDTDEPAPFPAADVPAAWPVTGTRLEWQSGWVIDVRTDTVQAPDGQQLTRQVVEHSGAVGIICLDDQDRVLVVRQYRHPVRHELVEPPAGLLDVDGETYHVAAARELFEEGHVRASQWSVLVDATTSPGMTSETIRIYLARGVTDVPVGERHVGTGEEAGMRTGWIPLEDLVEAVLAGRLHNPTMVMGVLAAAAAKRRGWRTLRPADSPWEFRDQMLAATAADGPSVDHARP